MSEPKTLTVALFRHRIYAYGPRDCRCACGSKWMDHADYRGHLAAQVAEWLRSDEVQEVVAESMDRAGSISSGHVIDALVARVTGEGS